MTKPAMPPATTTADVVEIEIDAMDGMEWEQGQRTPQASDANLAALVKESANVPEPAAQAPRKTQVKTRARGPGPAPSPAARVGNAATPSGQRTLRSPNDHVERVGQVAQVARTTQAGYPASLAAPSAGRPLSPAPVAVARAGSPPQVRAGSPAFDRAPSSAGIEEAPVSFDDVTLRRPGGALSSAQGASALGSSVLGTSSALGASALGTSSALGAPALGTSSAQAVASALGSSALSLEASSSLMESSGVLAPGVAWPEVSGSPPSLSLNDILRAPSRAMPADSAAAPILLPLPAPAESVRNPAPLVIREHAAAPPPDTGTETGERLASASWRRLLLVIGGTAGCAVLVTALVVMTGGKSDEHPSVPPVEDPVQAQAGPARADAVAQVTPPTRPGSALVHPTAASGSAHPVAAPEPAAPEPPGRHVSLALASELPPSVAANPPGRQPGRRRSSKKLVNDYTQPSETPGLVAHEAEDPAIGLARTAYLRGNQQLFDGDAGAAIRAYRQCLSLYPGYVGGYRGLGLAYAQLGDNQNALEAFQMYVETVPGAKDVALIKKRIARLQGK